MKKTFDFNRFGKVITNDLIRVWQNYGYSMLILMLIPAIVCFFCIVFPLVFGGEVAHIGIVGRLFMYAAASAALIVSFPAKVYGHLTDKRYGTDFLMLPASTLEKFASMILVSAVIAPAIFSVGFVAVDSILSVTGLFDGGNLIAFVKNSALMDNEYVSVNVWLLAFYNIALNMLVFLLGAIYFKRAKAALTIFSLMGVSILFSITAGPIMAKILESGHFLSFTEEDLAMWFQNHIDMAGFYINLLINGVQAFWTLVVGGLIYLRVKTLKH